jgi:hypothetical protein
MTAKPNPIRNGISKRLITEIPGGHISEKPDLGARNTPTQPINQIAPIESTSVRFTIWLAISPDGNSESSRRKMIITNKISKYIRADKDIFFSIDDSFYS